eukprot:366569-Chlamydomonas_euryale.AAC.28
MPAALPTSVVSGRATPSAPAARQHLQRACKRAGRQASKGTAARLRVTCQPGVTPVSYQPALGNEAWKRDRQVNAGLRTDPRTASS